MRRGGGVLSYKLSFSPSPITDLTYKRACLPHAVYLTNRCPPLFLTFRKDCNERQRGWEFLMGVGGGGKKMKRNQKEVRGGDGGRLGSWGWAEVGTFQFVPLGLMFRLRREIQGDMIFCHHQRLCAQKNKSKYERSTTTTQLPTRLPLLIPPALGLLVLHNFQPSFSEVLVFPAPESSLYLTRRRILRDVKHPKILTPALF